ncbi:MAG: serine/threonine protein kinase [Sandaracinaceae bacterium]|nr:serine/threonine protein kinase [Sandaracinaceae bacterium]
MADDQLELEGVVIDGKYALDGRLGRGGMGEVWRGRHRLTGRRVAVKFLLQTDDATRQRFLNEALAMGRLAHANVVDVYDVGQHGELTYIVMEYLRGRPLTSFISEDGLDPPTAIGLMMPALAGVAAAHQAGLLHRDLKPDNLFVLCEDDGTPYDTKVLDFGIAKAVDRDVKLTVSGALVGTPRYMAPETLAEVPRADERTDVFALGLILFELLAGRLPYRSTGFQSLLVEIMTMDMPSVADLAKQDLPEGLAAVVDRALSREPADRFASVEALARALEPWGGGVEFTKPRKSKATTWNLPDVGPLPWAGDDVGMAATTPSGRPPPRPSSSPPPAEPKKRKKETIDLGRNRPSTPASPSRDSIRLPPNKTPMRIAMGMIGGALLGVVILGTWWALSDPSPAASAPTPPVARSPAPTPPAPAPAPEPEATEPAEEAPAVALPMGVEVPEPEPAPDPEPAARRQASRRQAPTPTTSPTTTRRSTPAPTADQPIDPFAM